jgi:hypothetical protein
LCVEVDSPEVELIKAIFYPHRDTAMRSGQIDKFHADIVKLDAFGVQQLIDVMLQSHRRRTSCG